MVDRKAAARIWLSPVVGETIEQLLVSYQGLTEAAIRAALLFAAQVLRADVVYPILEQTLSWEN